MSKAKNYDNMNFHWSYWTPLFSPRRYDSKRRCIGCKFYSSEPVDGKTWWIEACYNPKFCDGSIKPRCVEPDYIEPQRLDEWIDIDDLLESK